MFAGYVQKRTSPVSPPPMQRVYSVLWGTLLMDYETEEESKTSLSPRLCVEVLGVSEWDGRGRANNYMYGFLIVTHTGATYYVSVNTQQERDEWVLQLKRSLECVFANPEVAPFKPAKILSPRPEPSSNALCPATKNIINKSSAVYCRCCGLGYYAAEHVAESSTALQIAAEEAERVCLNCKNAQAVILWLKSMNYVHTMALHEGTRAVLTEVHRFKASFQLRLRQSDRLHQAAQLLQQGQMTAEEFEELRQVDHSYRRELLYEEGVKLKGAVDAFGDDMQTIIDVILNSALIDKGGRWSQQAIILKVLEVADRAPDIVDFYLPQLLQAHLIIAETRTPEALVKLDLFQQALLVMAQKYPALGLKLCWGLVASVGDYAEKRCSQVQYAACVALLLQLEMVTTGYVSCIADVPTCKQLGGAMVGAMHQQQEVGCEIGALFLVRRRLQELTDDEELDRKVRRGLIDPALLDEDGNLKPGAEVAASVGPRASNAKGSLIPSEASCVDLLYQLGVGQAGRGGNRFSDDDSDNADSEDDPAEGDDQGEGQGGADGGKAGGRSRGPVHPAVPRYLGFQCFSEQLDFIHMLNGVVEGLRFIDRPLRTKVLLKEVARWNAEPLRYLGWDPTCIAGEPFYRIMHIVPGECRVFRTKARAPTMLVCEVLRDDLVPVYLDMAKQRQKSLASGTKQENAAALQLGGAVTFSVESTGADSLQLAAPAADPSVATPTHAVSRRAPNPLFVSNVDAHTIDAASRDIDVAAAERSEAAQQALEPGSARRHSADGLTAHDALAVMAAAEANSQLKTLHLEREKFATTSKNIEDVGNLISNMSLGTTQALRSHSTTPATAAAAAPAPASEGPHLRRGEAAHEHVTARAATPLDESSGNGRSGTSSPGRSTPAAPVLRKGNTRSVLASTRLSIKNGVADLIRPPPAAAAPTARPSMVEDRDRESLALPSPLAGQQHQARLSPAGPHLRMSTSGVFRPLPIPEAGSSSADDGEHGGIFRDAPSEDFSQFVGDREEGSEDSFSVKAAAAGSSQVTQKVLSSAQRLLADGVIDAAEYEALIASDQHFQDETAREEAVIARHKVEDAFGESWECKKERILGDKLQMFGPPSQDAWPAWDLRSFIMKSNDDLRQEVCCLQLMQLFKEIFEHFGLQQSLFLRPYRIVCTGCSTGLVQVLTDAMSLDALKKTEGFTTLAAYFQKTYDTSAERYNSARLNFASSLAAYSLFSYLLLIKDRHNGNLMIDAEGHILHIDFGFLLSIAPGGSFSLETAPFKLTEEMVEVLGGLDSPLFGEFLTAFTKGFIALQSNAENIISALQILAHNSSFPCFAGKQASAIIDKLRARFRTELSVNDAVKHCLDLITNSYGHYGTRQYDTFQWMTNGIMP